MADTDYNKQEIIKSVKLGEKQILQLVPPLELKWICHFFFSSYLTK